MNPFSHIPVPTHAHMESLRSFLENGCQGEAPFIPAFQFGSHDYHRNAGQIPSLHALSWDVHEATNPGRVSEIWESWVKALVPKISGYEYSAEALPVYNEIPICFSGSYGKYSVVYILTIKIQKTT